MLLDCCLEDFWLAAGPQLIVQADQQLLALPQVKSWRTSRLLSWGRPHGSLSREQSFGCPLRALRSQRKTPRGYIPILDLVQTDKLLYKLSVASIGDASDGLFDLSVARNSETLWHQTLEEPSNRDVACEACAREGESWETRCHRAEPHLAQLMARLASESMRSGREWLLPVLESRPANTMGSRAPSSSGRATLQSTNIR